MSKTELMANVMMENFEATRIEHVKMLVQLTNTPIYQHLIQTKNNPAVSRILKDQQQKIASLEAQRLKSSPVPDSDIRIQNLEIYDRRCEIEEAVIRKEATQEILSQYKALTEEKIKLEATCESLLRSQRF